MLIGASAQSVTTASSSMTASPWAQQVPFDIAAEGQKFTFTTGMGGWSDIEFAKKQRNWVGKENLGIARVAFWGRNSTTSTGASSLTTTQKDKLDTELLNISETGVKNVLLLCDMDTEVEITATNWNSSTNAGKRRRSYYVNEIVLAVKHIESQKNSEGENYKVVAVAPFNEPDYNVENNCGNATTFNTIAALMQQKTELAGRVYGPNTLNNTVANTWYGTVSDNINFVNTHQLDGSFDDLVTFWETGIGDGKVGAPDEMHNVLEAMIAMNYGASYGTWWGYDGVARAEFSRMTSMGRQIAYVEDRTNFAVAGIFRYDGDTDKVKAIAGTSERNALPTAFTYLSKGRLAYYDGYGPVYDYTQSVPGGTGYWKGQTNAERIVNIYTGEDVPMWNVNGNYKLVNKKSGKVLSTRNGELFDAVSVCQYADGLVSNQEWSIRPVGVAVGGDFSYHFITNTNTSSNTFHLDDLNWGLDEGTEIIAYPGGGSGCEQWHVRYVGDGYYTIINRHSGLCLEVVDGRTTDGASVVQKKVDESDAQLWKLIPSNAVVDAVAPAKPVGLKATSYSGSILLEWTTAEEKDIYGHNIYRYNDLAKIWECIGRGVKGNSFLDNTCRKGQSLRYHIKAVDKSINLSEASEEVTTTTSTDHALVGHWGFAGNLKDATDNQLHAVSGGEPTFVGSGTNAGVALNGTDQFVKLPYHVGDMNEMTFAAWVKGGSTTAWQRIFDFGNGEDEYLFLTPTNGSKMRFEIKKDGVIQGLDATTTLGTGTWKHVAVTIGSDKVTIYINGVENASTTSITLRPSDIVPTVSYIGRSQFDADPTFNGSIGDVRVYNYALTPNEVAALAQQKSTPQASDSPYELTSAFIPSLAEKSGNWTSMTGSTGSYISVSSSGYTRIYMNGSKIEGVNTAMKSLPYMPVGTYRVTAQVATNNDASNVWITAQNEQASTYTSGVSSYKTFTVDAAVTEADDFNFNLGLRQVFDEWAAGATEVRAKDYRLYYIGSKIDFDEALRKMLQSYIDDAGDFSSEPMNKDARAAFNAAVDEAQATCDRLDAGSLSTTHANVVAAIKKLLTARATAQASVDAYKALGVQIASAYAKHLLFPQQQGYDVFSNDLSMIENKYYDGNYADNEIPTAVIEVKGITNRYMMADAVTTATTDNPVDVTTQIVGQASFENNSYAPYWETSPVPGTGYDGVEFYNVNFDFFQILYGMPAGTYRLYATAFYRSGEKPTNEPQYNAKLYIKHDEGSKNADIMLISDDPLDKKGDGNWFAYDGKYVPDNMQAASAAIDNFGKYHPKDGYNCVDITVSSDGTLVVGAKKDVLIAADWTFFGGFSLYYLGDGKRRLILDEQSEVAPNIKEDVTYDEVILKRPIRRVDERDTAAWNSFVVPFDMPIPEHWAVKELASSRMTIHGTDTILSITFDDIDGDVIKAGVPYMVRDTMKNEYSVFTASNVSLKATPETVRTDNAEFVGVYTKGYVPRGAFFISNNTFYRAAYDGKNTIKGFRAFLMPLGEAAKARSLSYRTDGVVEDDEDDDDNGGTAVDPATGGATVVAIYNTRGERLSDLQDGINILHMSDGTTVKVVIR